MDYDALVIGSGIGGMESALKLGDMGYKVLVVEKEPSVGGKMILLSKVFPTLDCASCISTPKMAATVHHPNVTVFTGSEVGEIVRNRDGTLPRDRPSQAALRRRSALHRLPPVRARLHRRGARPVQRRARLAPRGLHRVPAGRPAEGVDRACRYVAVLVRVPGGDQGARLRLARAERRVREGIRPRARGDAARRAASVAPATRPARRSARAAASKGRCRSAASSASSPTGTTRSPSRRRPSCRNRTASASRSSAQARRASPPRGCWRARATA